MSKAKILIFLPKLVPLSFSFLENCLTSTQQLHNLLFLQARHPSGLRLGCIPHLCSSCPHNASSPAQRPVMEATLTTSHHPLTGCSTSHTEARITFQSSKLNDISPLLKPPDGLWPHLRMKSQCLTCTRPCLLFLHPQWSLRCCKSSHPASLFVSTLVSCILLGLRRQDIQDVHTAPNTVLDPTNICQRNELLSQHPDFIVPPLLVFVSICI